MEEEESALVVAFDLSCGVLVMGFRKKGRTRRSKPYTRRNDNTHSPHGQGMSADSTRPNEEEEKGERERGRGRETTHK